MAKKTVSNNKSKIIIAVGIIIAIAVIIGVVVFLFKKKPTSNNDSIQTSAAVKTSEDGSADGSLYDYEKAGYLSLGKYKGIEVAIEATDEDVMLEIQNRLDDYKWKDSDVVKKGDVIFVDYEGSVDGIANSNLQGENIYIKVGDYKFIKSFEDDMVGKPIGKKCETFVRFPDDYADLSVAGKTVKFKVSILSAINDDITKAFTKNKYDSYSKFKDAVKEDVRKDNIESIGESAWSDYTDNTDVDKYPKGLVSKEYKVLKQQYKDMAKAQEIEYEELLEQFGMSEESLKETAELDVKERMLAKTIIVRENLVFTDEYFEKFLRTAMEEEESKKSLAELKKMYLADYGLYPKDDAYVDFVKQYIGKNAKRV